MARAPRPRLALAALAASSFLASAARADLESYVKAKDGCFAWSVHSTVDLPDGSKGSIVRLVSQRWQGIEWEHWLYVVRPEQVSRPEHAMLVVAGGSKRPEPPKGLNREALTLASVAQKTGTVIAVLANVPNQPLFGNLKEDALIAHTFVKFMETRDDTWPCLLPMAKSAVRAMDAVQAFLREEHSQEVKRFFVTGASKRGWTTWLTAAVDPRVVAIAPMVIDTLNMAKQMPHQLLSFGKYSEEIEDYTRLNLPQRTDGPESKHLRALVDPYSYLEKLTLPKLVVLGTNDRYWPVDAVKLYFPDLRGEKHLHHLPNAGHGLGLPAVEAITAFYQMVIAGERRPRYGWKLESQGGEAVLSIAAEDAPEGVELWKAGSPTRDFRDARWEGSPLEKGEGGKYTARVGVPAEGFAAFFGRLAYKSTLGHTYYLTTNVEVVGGKPRARV